MCELTSPSYAGYCDLYQLRNFRRPVLRIARGGEIQTESTQKEQKDTEPGAQLCEAGHRGLQVRTV